MSVYYKGETIDGYITGDENVDFDTLDFTLSFVSCVGSAVEIAKADCTASGTNKYYFEIANTVTKDLPTGDYAIEVFTGDEKTLIGKKIGAFTLRDSHSKKYVS